MKSEGVKDIVKMLEQRCKQAKKELDEAHAYVQPFFSDYDYKEGYIREAQAVLNTLVSVKISTEKYMKKLQYEEQVK